MEIDNTTLTTLTEEGASCSENCKIYNKATVSYDYVVDNETNSGIAESGTVSTCIQQKSISSFNTLKIASQRYIKPKDIVTFTMVVTNTGNTSLNTVSLSDTLDTNLEYIGSANLYINGVYVAPVVDTTMLPTVKLTFPVGFNLLPGQTAVFTFKVKVKESVAPGTIILNKATINSKDQNNKDVGPKDTNEVQLIAKSVELEVIKTAPKAVECGGPLTYTINVTNKSTEYDAKNVVITDYFDPEFTFDLSGVTAPTDSVKEKIDHNGVKVTIPAMKPGQTIAIIVTGTINCCCPN